MKVKMLTEDGGFNIHKGSLKGKTFEAIQKEGSSVFLISNGELYKQGIVIDENDPDGDVFLWCFTKKEGVVVTEGES